MEMIITVAIAALGAIWPMYVYYSSKRREKKQATIEAYNRLQYEVLDTLYTCYPPARVKEIVKDTRSDEYRKLSTLVARIEHFCVGIDMDIYDKKVLKELAGGFFDGTIKNRIMPLLNMKNSCGISYYDHTEKIYEWMKSEKDKKRDFRNGQENS